MNDAYPLLKGSDKALPQCVHCKRSCGEPGEFLMLQAGAILCDDDTHQIGGTDDRLVGFLTLTKHGAEPSGKYTTLDLFRDLIGGQGEVLFCSADCLKAVLNGAVNELDRRWQQD